MFGKKNEKQPDMELFSVFDSKTGIYGEPLPCVNHLDALREFSQAFGRPDAPLKNKFFINAEDFSLFKVGSYDKRTGEITSHRPTHVVNFHDLKADILRRQTASEDRALLPT